MGSKRSGVYVDVQNIFHCLRAVFPDKRINYQALREFFLRDNEETFFIAFSSYDPDNYRQYDFLNAMGLMGYRIVARPLRKMQDGGVKANMDMEMALEILATSPSLDEIVLVTGDGDFVPLVHYLVRSGKRVRVVGPDKLTAPELIHACHDFLNLSQIPGIFSEISSREESYSYGM
jgi:uncharacterized LabA/DUF88 family protein